MSKPRLIIATGNAHKVEEIRAILGARFDYFSLQQFPGAPKAVEDENSFEGNAVKKAVAVAEWLVTQEISGTSAGDAVFILADDSGLEVDALSGAPGVHSARFAALDSGAAGNSSDADNNAKLLRLLATVPTDQRRARFRCALALVELRGDCLAAPRIFEGTCEGRITDRPSGSKGFGYDPLFIPDGYPQSFAELGAQTKNALSHRAKALQGLKAFLSAAG